ncbi:MlaE family ABC transporter permease [Advenella mimigardefordensis]|uniref:Putative ABC transporter permease protein n=1 Tax=Advenella mimigardefordensis (strain DSM 17166 / LMG 22922 / DPN7) TaxID=1247726 RepID=W0PAT1_ADVMD|nr:ABC transporter permease [Advenella mimigardefordensis]AHG62525.1 putative ABC transporter permease protein [Advenella mimigardefordensis DPN7]
MSDAASSSFLSLNAQQAIPRGAWTLANYAQISDGVARVLAQKPVINTCDLAALDELDTAGAQLLVRLLGPDMIRSLDAQQTHLSPERLALLARVALSLSQDDPDADRSPSRVGAIRHVLARIGEGAERFYTKTVALIGFIGVILEALLRNLLHPRQWRVTSMVAQIEETGLNAVPIVALLTFMVGAVIAFLGATILESFGASIYTVNLVAFSFLREFAVLLTAILMAGRTASAFTAQIGSMKANEEIDALRALGLNPTELLVIPRVLAMMISLPLLTFVGMVAGMAGGAVVCAATLDISPTLFIAMIQQNIGISHFLLGMAKAPLFAFLIAAIGCNEGFLVSGSAQSVGEHTTSSVVQSIFVVIFLDAVAALFYMEMGW